MSVELTFFQYIFLKSDIMSSQSDFYKKFYLLSYSKLKLEIFIIEGLEYANF